MPTSRKKLSVNVTINLANGHEIEATADRFKSLEEIAEGALALHVEASSLVITAVYEPDKYQ